MKNGRLTLVPSGGLANRMRAIASAHCLCQQTDSSLQVIWFRDWALNAPFNSIFLPQNLTIREATPIDYLLNDRPRKRNLWIPKFIQQAVYRHAIYETDIDHLRTSGFNFEAWRRGHSCYMSDFNEFGTVPDDVYRQLFVPTEIIRQKIQVYTNRFTSHTIGMHIRRTDNVYAIRMSPTELFVERAAHETDLHSDTTIFLATDDEQVKELFRRRFGSRIITPEEQADRNSIEGILNAAAEMYTLAETSIIYGSAWSSFSEMAAKIGNRALTVVTSDNHEGC